MSQWCERIKRDVVIGRAKNGGIGGTVYVFLAVQGLRKSSILIGLPCNGGVVGNPNQADVWGGHEVGRIGFRGTSRILQPKERMRIVIRWCDRCDIAVR